MVRKKSCSVRSGKVPQIDIPSSSGIKIDKENGADSNCESTEPKKPFYVDIDRSHWTSEEHFDIAEVRLNNVNFADEMTQNRLIENNCQESSFSLRFSLFGVEEGSFRLGHWPVLPADSVILEYVVLEESGECTLLFSGSFDGPEESVSGLVHLVNQKRLALRLASEFGNLRKFSDLRVRVEVLRSVLDACECMLEIGRQQWRKSMVNVMSWLRPEVTTSEAIYGMTRLKAEDCDVPMVTAGAIGSRKHAAFDVAGFYEAIKPSKDEPMLEDELPDLLPCLRPYQRRAAYWMVQREKGIMKASSEEMQNQLTSPFSVPVTFIESDSRMFYNPFNGSVSLYPQSSSLYVSGGILADEMGLGKTVELLACIFTHRRLSLKDCIIPDDNMQDIQIRRQKLDRVECICGAASKNPRYKGLWVQCDICDAWQHANCVGYSPKKKPLVSHELYKGRTFEKDLPIKSEYCEERKSSSSNIIETDESYICSLCSELMEAAKIKISTGATLIVCPASILAQWHSEISRHTRPGSLKIWIYEGARNLTSSTILENHMNELASADIVLTTYDVLKEDLSHDFDRHDGDRRFMRFQKRYPVIPTLLTRIHWWRLCLDEAQMVECNTASVTEMAMRLHAEHRWCVTGTPVQRKLDDLYGLLRFLRASPFDVYRWWAEVIKDPYEGKDVVAMEFAHSFFKQIMWRSSKVHVSDELQLPSQEECLSWLTFSQIEQHFYQKQYETCMKYAHAIITKWKSDIHHESFPGSGASISNYVSHTEVEKLLFTLLKLRQACCHPQVGSSGLCSLQHSPLTMEEILEVLIGKAKIEGEEALRGIVAALNGLAGIAILEEDNNQAMSLYKEALALADDNCDDFRLDPLQKIHIHHNLAELLSVTSDFLDQCPVMGEHFYKNNDDRKSNGFRRCYPHNVKRQKLSKDRKSVSTANGDSAEHNMDLDNGTSHLSIAGNDGDKDADGDARRQVTSRCYAAGCIQKTCENLKYEYLSSYLSKLSAAQQKFRMSYKQVCDIFKEFNSQGMTWWLHAIDCIEKNDESSKELLKKINEAVSGDVTSSRSLKISYRIRSIGGLKYTIQTGLDVLVASREALIDRIIEIDETMERPKDTDLERVRYCPNCNNGNGSLCIHCELHHLFQVYEAELFLLRKASSGSLVSSEEALALQNHKAAVNRFFRDKETSIKSHADDEKSKQRYAKGDIQVSKRPSPLETTLRVIKGYSKALLGRQGVASAKKHLLLLEAMRKEYDQARYLSRAQAQLLGAYDEIKMSTSRMTLKETQDEPTSTTALSREELLSHRLQYSSDKLLSLTSLARIRGQLRYLKGLVLSNQKTQDDRQLSSKPQDAMEIANSPLATEESGGPSLEDGEPCPICHEKLHNTRMVFPCGHVICCKCCLQMTEKVRVQSARFQQKRLMCPTCRQRTDVKHIAYVDEKRKMCSSHKTSDASQTRDISENTIAVHGSYGTKVEAVTRKILWITSTDQKAKVIVFSSWNDVLDVLQHALAANGITYVRMKGGRKSQVALANFKGQKSTSQGGKMERKLCKSEHIQVLLMLIQHGANGLNILEAQHVVLMEPLLNPAAEAQAISRVHRMGQEKKTFVHRFIVKNSVEESIYNLNRSRSVSSVIGTKTKHQDQPVLTIEDVELLFPTAVTTGDPDDTEVTSDGLRHLPPAVAAGLAAERRLMESRRNSA